MPCMEPIGQNRNPAGCHERFSVLTIDRDRSTLEKDPGRIQIDRIDLSSNRVKNITNNNNTTLLAKGGLNQRNRLWAVPRPSLHISDPV